MNPNELDTIFKMDKVSLMNKNITDEIKGTPDEPCDDLAQTQELFNKGKGEDTAAAESPENLKNGNEADKLKYKLLEIKAEYDCFKQKKLDEIVRLNYKVKKLT